MTEQPQQPLPPPTLFLKLSTAGELENSLNPKAHFKVSPSLSIFFSVAYAVLTILGISIHFFSFRSGAAHSYPMVDTTRLFDKTDSISAELYDWEMDLNQGKKDNPSLKFIKRRVSHTKLLRLGVRGKKPRSCLLDLQ